MAVPCATEQVLLPGAPDAQFPRGFLAFPPVLFRRLYGFRTTYISAQLHTFLHANSTLTKHYAHT